MSRVALALGRYVGPSRTVRGWSRVWAGLTSVVLLAVLVIARGLPPDSRGFGTHEALGLPPCGFILTSGLPCPSCGMTTAFSNVMHGRLWDAFIAQPAGMVLCLSTMFGAILAARIAATGRMVQVNWDSIGPVRLMLAFALLVVGGWAFKMAHGFITGTLPAPH